MRFSPASSIQSAPSGCASFISRHEQKQTYPTSASAAINRNVMTLSQPNTYSVCDLRGFVNHAMEAAA